MKAQAKSYEAGRDQPAESEGQKVILKAALDAFVEHGFHGTAVRDIAARANLSVAAIYYHFPSKLDILYSIMSVGADHLIAELAAERDRAGDDPVAQFVAVVRTHLKFHTRQKAEAFIGNTELRSLDEVRRRAIVAKRDAIAALFVAIAEQGLARGLFDTPWPRETVRAILTMCTAVAGWYRKNGPESPDTIADRYADMALRMLGCRPKAR